MLFSILNMECEAFCMGMNETHSLPRDTFSNPPMVFLIFHCHNVISMSVIPL